MYNILNYNRQHDNKDNAVTSIDRITDDNIHKPLVSSSLPVSFYSSSTFSTTPVVVGPTMSSSSSATKDDGTDDYYNNNNHNHSSNDDLSVMKDTTSLTTQSYTHQRSKWILCSRISLGILYCLVIALAGVVIWQLVVRSSERHVIAWAVGAMAVGIAVPLSLHDIHLHILNYVSPLQKYYVSYHRITIIVYSFFFVILCSLPPFVTFYRG